jgi:hypothetical protein
VQFEFDPFDLACILAAGVDVIVDRYLAECRRLVAREGGKIEVGVALGGLAHVVGHVGGGDLVQLSDHPIGRHPSALGALRPGLFDRVGNLKFS